MDRGSGVRRLITTKPKELSVLSARLFASPQPEDYSSTSLPDPPLDGAKPRGEFPTRIYIGLELTPLPPLSFKSDSRFFRLIAVGAVGTRAVTEVLYGYGHEMAELENGSTDVKIWKDVKRRRLVRREAAARSLLLAQP